MSLPRLRGCLAGLAVALVLGGVGLFLAWRALDTAFLRAFVEERLSATLGAPVTIGRMRLSLLGTPAVEGREIRVGSGEIAAAPSVSMAAVRMVPQLSSLLSSHVVVRRIEVEGLTVRVLRQRDGTWALPLPARSAGATSGAGSGREGASGGRTIDVDQVALNDGSLLVVGPAATTAAPPGLRRVAATLRVEGGEVRFESMTAAIGGSTVSGRGTASADGLRLSLEWKSFHRSDLPEVFALLGSTAPTALSVEGDRPLALELLVDANGAVSATGRVAASKVGWGTATLASLASPLRLAANHLALEPLTFDAYGGRTRGALTADLGAAPVGWSFQSTATGVNLNQLLSANTSARDKVSGIAQIDATLRGTAVAPLERSMTGTMAVGVANGSIREFPLLRSLDSALHLGTGNDKRDLRFDRLSATLHVANATMTTSDLVAVTGELTIAASGTLRFDQSLDLIGTARYTRAASDDLVRRAKDLGGLRNPQGEIEVPFSVTGTASAPAFAIDLEKVLRRAAGKELRRQLNRQLKRLFKR